MTDRPANSGPDREPRSGEEPDPGAPRSQGQGATRTDDTRTADQGATSTSHGGTTTPPPPPHSSAYDSLRRLDVRRTPDRWLGGVAAGLAHRMGLDPLVVRAGFVVLGLFFGLGAALYLVAWALIPDSTESTHLEQGLRNGKASSILLLVVAAIAVLGTVPWWDGGIGGSPGGALFGLVVLGIIGYACYRAWTARPNPGAVSEHGYRGGYATEAVGATDPTAASTFGYEAAGAPAPPPPPGSGSTTFAAPATAVSTPSGAAGFDPQGPPPPPGGSTTYSQPQPPPVPPPGPRRARRRSGGGAVAVMTAGALLTIVGGLIWAAEPLNLPGNPITVGWSAGLAMLGLVLLGLGLVGRRAGWVGFLAAVAAFAVVVTAPLPSALRWNGEVGEVTWTPTATSQETKYEWGAGNPRLDLRALNPGDVRVDEMDVALGLGELTIYVPEDLNVVINSDIGAGAVSEQDSFTLTDRPEDLPASTRDDEEKGGVNFTHTTWVGTNPPDLEVNAHVGLGQVTIVTEGP